MSLNETYADLSVSVVVMCVHGLVFALATLLSLLGNILIISSALPLLASRPRTSRSIHVYGFTLAVVDILFCLLLLLTDLSERKLWLLISDYYCYFTCFCKLWLGLLGTAIICFLSLDRYIAVCHPLRSKQVCRTRPAYKVATTLTLLTAARATPAPVLYIHSSTRMIWRSDTELISMTFCEYQSSGSTIFYSFIASFFFLLALTTAAIHLWIYIYLRRSRHMLPEHGRASTARERSVVRAGEERRRAAQRMLLIACLYMACLAPDLVLTMYVVEGSRIGNNLIFGWMMTNFSHTLGKLLNPVIYATYSRSFKRQMLLNITKLRSQGTDGEGTSRMSTFRRRSTLISRGLSTNSLFANDQR